MTRHVKTLATWAVLALLLALLLPAASAAEDKTKGQAAPAASAAAAKPAAVSKPSQPPAASPAPATPAPPAGEQAEAESEDEGGTFDGSGGGDKVVVMSDVEIPAGREIAGDVVCIVGDVKLLGKVRGDVIVIGGKLDMFGSVRGGVVGVGSKLVLHPGAHVRKDLVNVGGGLDRGGATIGGQVVNIGVGGAWLAHMPGPFGVLGLILFWIKLLKLVLVFIGLLLLTALAPDRIRLLGEEAPLHPFLSFFAGLGGYIVLALTMILLCITIIGIPAALLLYFAFIVVKWMGLAGIFEVVGKRIGRLMGRDFSLLGAVLLGFLPFAILRFLPFCIGTFIWFVLDAMAVGLVILTRFGGRRYGAASPPPITVPPAPVSPAPAAPVP
jgi:hypothetical protein